MKRIECKNHAKQPITNFCKNSQCFLPLCPECVVLHTSYHREMGLHGEFDTIENTFSFCQSKLLDFEKNYSQFESQLAESMNEIKNEENGFIEKLDELKKEVISLIERDFENLKRDVSSMFRGFYDGMTRDYTIFTRELQLKKSELAAMQQALEASPTKTLIELYSTPFVIEQCDFQIQLEAFRNHLQEQRLDLNVEQRTLHEIEALIQNRLVGVGKKNVQTIMRKMERKPVMFNSPESKIPRLRMGMEQREFRPDHFYRSPDQPFRSPDYSRLNNGRSFILNSPFR